jgi:hypothetical protein
MITSTTFCSSSSSSSSPSSSSSSSPEVLTAKKNVRLVREAAGLVSQRITPPRLSETNSKLKDVVKQRSNPSKKLLALGTALLIMHDPITDAAAVPVLIAGKIFQSRQSSNIKDVYEELGRSLAAISSLSSF